MEHDYYSDHAFCMQRSIAQATLADDIRGGYFFASLSPCKRMAAIRRSQDKAIELALCAAKFLAWARDPSLTQIR